MVSCILCRVQIFFENIFGLTKYFFILFGTLILYISAITTAYHPAPEQAPTGHHLDLALEWGPSDQYTTERGTRRRDNTTPRVRASACRQSYVQLVSSPKLQQLMSNVSDHRQLCSVLLFSAKVLLYLLVQK